MTVKFGPKLQAAQAAFGAAQGAFLGEFLQEVADQDMKSGLAIMQALHDGAFITITSSTSPLTRACSCVITLTDKKGQRSTLAEVEFETEATNG